MWVRVKRLRYVVVGALIVAAGLFPAGQAQAVSAGDGKAIYGNNSTSVAQRDWTNASNTFSSQTSLTGTTDTNPRFVVSRASPTSNEIISMVMTNATLYVYRWDGSAWHQDLTIATGFVGPGMPRFSVSYADTGQAMIFYNTSTNNNRIRYRMWNGSVWSTEESFTPVRTTSTVSYIVAHARPGTDEIGIAWSDNTQKLSASYYDVSSDTWAAEPSAALTSTMASINGGTNTRSQAFDLAFENSTQRMVVVWGNAGSTNINYAIRSAGTGGSWGSTTTATGSVQPSDVHLASEPGTNYIALAAAVQDGAVSGGAEGAIWNGSAWGNVNNYDTSIAAINTSEMNNDVAWVKNGSESRAIFMYDDSASASLDWIAFNKTAGTWGSPQHYTGSPTPSSAGNGDYEDHIEMNPLDNSQAMAIIVDNTSALFAKKLVFDGTNYTWSSVEPSGTALTSNTGALLGWAADFVYYRFAGVLSVDIVDGSGNSVTSPSVTMGVVPSSASCQTTTGTFGTSTQKIRLNNGTGTAAWSLSLGATGGSTATWSSGTDTYDYNDGGGSPPGCSDGGDVDTKAGQLTVDPSSGTLTPQSGCSSTGVSLGSSTAFSETGSVNSATVASATGSANTNCYWDITGVGLSQTIPAFQTPGSYSMQFTLTATAS